MKVKVLTTTITTRAKNSTPTTKTKKDNQPMQNKKQLPDRKQNQCSWMLHVPGRQKEKQKQLLIGHGQLSKCSILAMPLEQSTEKAERTN